MGDKKTNSRAGGRSKPVTLKALAEHLKLSPATVSVVINRSPVADSIPKETQDRIFQAARELDYRPNFMARSLRSRRSFSVGVLVPEISEPYAAGVLSGVETHLLQVGYFYLIASHRSKEDLLKQYLRLLEERLVEGFILVATPIKEAPPLPTVAIAGHEDLPGVSNVVLDHNHAAHMALSHLTDLGHEKIAFFKGHPNSADTEDRWRSILETADSLGLEVRDELTRQLAGEAAGKALSPERSYQEGYDFGQQLLASKEEFTSLFAFNDVSAIGAMRAILDAGLRVPEDVSVIGFDDIQSAAFQNPSLTTVRQPLKEMGQTAGRILMQRLSGDEDSPPGGTEGEEHCPRVVTVEPQLIIRDSTGPPPKQQRSRKPVAPAGELVEPVAVELG